jgi:hypothetical protein
MPLVDQSSVLKFRVNAEEIFISAKAASVVELQAKVSRWGA